MQQAHAFQRAPAGILFGDIGEKRDLAGSLDGLGEFALMLSAGAGGAAREDFAALGKEAAKLHGIFIINELAFVHAELANFFALAGTCPVVSLGCQRKDLLS